MVKSVQAHLVSIKAVADGEMAVGLSYEDPAVKLLNDGANIKVVYPKEGTVFLPASAAIVKKAKNMENAKKFIDFISLKKYKIHLVNHY